MSDRGVTESVVGLAAFASLETVCGCVQHGAEHAPIEPDCERITGESTA